MRSIQFSKWDPSGNTTLFFPQDTPGNHAALAHGALLQQKLGGEQAGFVDIQNGSLIMAGGEFCVSATRCFGALLDLCALRQGIQTPGHLHSRLYFCLVSRRIQHMRAVKSCKEKLKPSDIPAVLLKKLLLGGRNKG